MKSHLGSISRFIVLALAIGNACDGQGRDESVDLAKPARAPRKLATAHLPNAVHIHDKVISGGQPDGDAGFRELKELGIRTIISVDGAKPNLELAKKYGLRYVHLPHGYNGIRPERVVELAKAVRDLDGPIFIHCHRGKHRSPAAAAAACVSAGLIEPSDSLPILKLAGTSEYYLGLFDSVSSAKRLSSSFLDRQTIDFPESAKLPPMAKAMVELEHTHDQLKRLAEFGWNRLPDHPDLSAAHEALLLSEHFTEMLRMESVTAQPAGFLSILRDSEADAQLLEKGIRQWNESLNSNVIPANVSEPFRRINTNCTNCHRHYRDVPIGNANLPINALPK